MKCSYCGDELHLGSCGLESKEKSHGLRVMLRETIDALQAATAVISALEEYKKLSKSELVKNLEKVYKKSMDMLDNPSQY